MKTRKIVLIAADVILLGVCIFQFAYSKKSTIKNFLVKDIVDELTIKTPDGNIHLVSEGEDWFVGDKKYPANINSVNLLIDDICTIKALDSVGKVGNANHASRYEMTDDKTITVTAMREGNVLRTLTLGKESDTGVQCYGSVDDGKDIYLFAGNLRLTFDKTVDNLRSKTVFELDKNEINAATVISNAGEQWTLSRFNSGDNISWVMEPDTGREVDVSKASEWLGSLNALTTSKWYSEEDAAALAGIPDGTIRIVAGMKIITLDMFKIPASGAEGSKDIFYGKCSESPYTFDIASYAVSKFQKDAGELLK